MIELFELRWSEDLKRIGHPASVILAKIALSRVKEQTQ
jgi:hypothetical protein